MVFQNASKEFVVTEEFAPPLRRKGSENITNCPYSWQTTYHSGEEKVAAAKSLLLFLLYNSMSVDTDSLYF